MTFSLCNQLIVLVIALALVSLEAARCMPCQTAAGGVAQLTVPMLSHPGALQNYHPWGQT